MVGVAPEDVASWINKALFWWVVGVLKLFGRDEYKLSEETLCRPRQRDESRSLLKLVTKKWAKERKNAGESLFRCLLESLGPEAVIVIPAALINLTSQLVQPTLVGEVVRYLQDPTYTTATWAYSLGALIVLLRMITCLSSVQCFHPVFRLAMRMRASLACMIYKKALDLKACQLEEYGSGHIINLLSTDLEVIIIAFQYSAYLLQGPIVTIVCVALIINEVGIISALPGLAFIIIILVIGAVFSKLQAEFRNVIASRTDKRIQMIHEVISAINVVKMHAWEKPFLKQIHKLRKTELMKIIQNGILYACNVAGVNSYHVVISALVLLTHAHTGGVLTPDLAIRVFGWASVIGHYLSISIINTLRAVAGYKSIGRIEEFLLADCHGLIPDEPEELNKGQLVVKELECTWNARKPVKDTIEPEEVDYDGLTLQNINLELEEGKLLLILGTVGAGKSSLLMALLNEMYISAGTLEISTNRSYSCQEPWIFSATVKENILFGDLYDQERYQQVLEACCLHQDIDCFTCGDDTQVGQRGLKLSGGQKARISLARAAYKNADVYIFDDPLSAVDAHVGHHLFTKCINGLNTSRTRIVVTHNPNYLTLADQIIILDQGRIVSHGTYDDVKDCSFLQSLKDLQKKIENEQIGLSRASDCIEEGHTGNLAKVEGDTLLSEEYASFPKQIWTYIKAGNVVVYVTFLAFLSVNQVILYSTSWWLTIWSEMDSGFHNSSSPVTHSRSYYSNIYIIIVVILVAMTFFWTLISVEHFYLASKSLHFGLITRILKAPMSYFDSTPVGNIVNNFSRDMGIVDLIISQQFRECTVVGTKFIGSVIFATVVSPRSGIGIPPFILVLGFIRWFAVRGSKNYKNLESACKSPVYSHVSNTLKGHTVIRAFNRQQQFVEQFHDLLDKHTAAWNMFICINRWMYLCVGISFTIYIMLLLLVSFFTAQSGEQSGLVGFSLIHAILCVETLGFFVQITTDVETQLTAVGRIQRSSEVPQEGPFENDKSLPKAWPTTGDLDLKDVSLKYDSSTNAVLKNISVSVQDGEKIGIVGRTGAGKSSIMRAVLRLTEPEGSIIIDSVDVKKVGLTDLRSRITAIPQDPVLFTGTVRRNLDPFEEHADDRLWDVLKQTQLDYHVRGLSNKLETEVGEGGSIFSAGQKQLMCLARALLRNNKILLIDEATANVDHQTDAIIQSTIRENLSECTVLTIAHRIQTVIDSDKVLVMDSGQLVEYGTPKNLLKNENGIFYKLTNGSKQ